MLLIRSFSVSLQRVGLHTGLQRQGGCRRLALGTEGKGIIIIIIHTNMHSKTDEEPLLQGFMTRPVMDLGSVGSVVAEALEGTHMAEQVVRSLTL